MSKGILLMSFGSQIYGGYAYNMANSIRRFSDVKIHLLTDEVSIDGFDKSVYSSIEIVDFDKDRGKIDPCLAKIKLFDRSPFDKTLYLDVDGIMLRNPDELFERFDGRTIYSQLMDFGKREDNISYARWASNKVVWDKFNLSEDSILPTVQTSIIYFEKSAKLFFDKLKENYSKRLNPEDYLEMWGKSKAHPDELYYGITMAQMDILPEAFDPVFFPERRESDKDILDNYYVLSMYGGMNVKPYAFKLYDKLMRNYIASMGKNHCFKARQMYKYKFINQK